MLNASVASHGREARFVVALVGVTVVSEIGFAVFPGILGGCHRFDLSNAITGVFEVGTWLTAIIALLMGGGLVVVASICLALSLPTEATRVACAYRICPEISVRLRYANLREARSLLGFGLKSQVSALSGLLLLQANKLFVGAYLGPAMLAVFSRPLTLLRVVDTFSSRLGSLPLPGRKLAPGPGTGVGDPTPGGGSSTRAGMALALPMVLTVAILGDPIMVLWMGDRYSPGLSVVVLASGTFLALALRPVQMVLLGLNLHGPLPWPSSSEP